jgi:hypothetical protein
MGSGVSPLVWSPGNSLYQAMPDKVKIQRAKCKIKEVIAALRQFHNFDFLFLIFAFPKICRCRYERKPINQRLIWSSNRALVPVS